MIKIDTNIKNKLIIGGIAAFVVVFIVVNAVSCAQQKKPEDDEAEAGTTSMQLYDGMSADGNTASTNEFSYSELDTETEFSIDIASNPISISDETLSIIADIDFPGTVDTMPDSKVCLGQLYLTPSKKWSTKLDGNTLTLVHENGAVFYIKRKEIAAEYSESTALDSLQGISETLGISSVKYSTVYSNSYGVGSTLVGELEIDDNPSMVLCSQFVLDNCGFTCFSVYDQASDEAISSLLSTFSFFETKLFIK